MDKMDDNEQLEILTQQIFRARIYYDLWWTSVGSETPLANAKSLEEFSEFLRFDAHAHFVTMIIHCATVWDNKYISLPRLGNEILGQERFGIHSTIWTAICDQKELANGIMKIRNEAIAHRSKFYDYDAVFERAKVIPDELPKMMTSWLDLVNELKTIRGMKCDKVTGETDFNNLPLLDMQKLIHKLGGSDLQPRTCLDEILKA